MTDLTLGFNLLVATLVGLAVGLEREWSSQAHETGARFAGLRTFALFGLIGGLGGWMATMAMMGLAVALVGGATVFIVAAFVSSAFRPDATAGTTTEVAAILVIALGVTSGIGHPKIASAVAAVVVLLLAEKSNAQRVMERIAVSELRATFRFAVMALVILPLLPNSSYGPYDAFNPRHLWIVVLLFSALNFAGYIARRLVGETHGLGITGLLGGLLSSTAVAFQFSRRSKEEPELSVPLALGVAAACTVLLPRLIVLATVLRPSMVVELVWLLGPPFLAGSAFVALEFGQEWKRRQREDVRTPMAPLTDSGKNPLAFVSSVQMALAFQIVLFIVAWANATVGTSGMLATAAVLGLTNMDALMLAMTKLAADTSSMHVAALAIGIGVLSNTALKSMIVAVLGAPRYRLRALSSLAVLGASGALTLWWRWT